MTKAVKVIEGRMTCFQVPMPPAGSHWSQTAKTTTSIRPNQNTGMEMPKRAVEVTK